MWRNIIGTAIYEIVVLIVLIFAGKEIFNIPYDDDSSLFYSTDGLQTPITNKVIHYTIIFNTFVFMQVFNEINARKLGANEYNVFKGFFNNLMFLGI